MEKCTTSGSLRVECFKPPMDVWGMLCVSSSCKCSASSVQVSGRTCHRSMQTPYSSGPLLDGGFLTSHSSLHAANFFSWCPTLEDLVMNVCVGLVLKGLQLLHLTLWFSEMCVAWTWVCFLNLSGCGRDN